jgi:transposase-like protein
MSTTTKRKQFSPQQKVAIVRRHVVEGVPVSDLCDEQGIHPTMYYRWQKQLFENGAMAFERHKDPTVALKRRIAQLETKLTTKNEVISELMEEQVKAKKELGDA